MNEKEKLLKKLVNLLMLSKNNPNDNEAKAASLAADRILKKLISEHGMSEPEISAWVDDYFNPKPKEEQRSAPPPPRRPEPRQGFDGFFSFFEELYQKNVSDQTPAYLGNPTRVKKGVWYTPTRVSTPWEKALMNSCAERAGCVVRESEDRLMFLVFGINREACFEYVEGFQKTRKKLLELSKKDNDFVRKLKDAISGLASITNPIENGLRTMFLLGAVKSEQVYRDIYGIEHDRVVLNRLRVIEKNLSEEDELPCRSRSSSQPTSPPKKRRRSLTKPGKPTAKSTPQPNRA